MLNLRLTKQSNMEKHIFNMKKIIYTLSVSIMLIVLSACGNSYTMPQSVDTVTGEKTSPVTDTVENETVNKDTSEVLPEKPLESVPQLFSYSVYVPNIKNIGLDKITVETEEISSEAVLTELKQRNVLPAEVSINSFNIDKDMIIVDFNQPFAKAVRSTGTTGELMVVGSVVNTFLDAFQAKSFYFTIDGNIFESGHVIYDFPMSFFSVTP